MDYLSANKVYKTTKSTGQSQNGSSSARVVHGTKYVNGTLVEEDPNDQIEAIPKKDQHQHKSSFKKPASFFRRPTEIVMPKPSIMKRSTTEVTKLKNIVTFRDSVQYDNKDSQQKNEVHSSREPSDQANREKIFNFKFTFVPGSSTRDTKASTEETGFGFKSVGSTGTIKLPLLSSNSYDKDKLMSTNASLAVPNMNLEEIKFTALNSESVFNPSPGSAGRVVDGDSVDCGPFWELDEKWQKILRQSRQRIWRNGEIVLGCKSNKSALPTLKTIVKMSDTGGLVSTLLRAARDANEELIKACLRDIIINGVTSEKLNSVDKSGRTAVSYICSNGLTQFLDIMLQLPEIDVNKADNDGNSPLHFAAEAGRADVIHMLITRRDRFLEVDAKNKLGFTPLMKAAIQGRTKCAKLLLFGGASPVATDPKRNYRADQWARFCAQHSCAEMIETCSRARLLGKTSSNQWAHDSNGSGVEKKVITRSNTGSLVNGNETPAVSTGGGGIRSKLRKVFPFGLALKDKSGGSNISKNKQRSETSDLVSYLSAAALCASSGPALAKEQSAFIKKLIHHQDVPKLEVTFANNATMIKKYS